MTKTGGILQPAMKHKFRINFDDANLTCQVMNCSIDMARKLLTIQIRQPIVAGVLSSIKELISVKRNLEIQILSGFQETPSMRILLAECEIMVHNVDFNYGNTDHVSHSMTFSYTDIIEV